MAMSGIRNLSGSHNALAQSAGAALNEFDYGRALAMRIIAEAKITDTEAAQRVISLCAEYLPTQTRLREIEVNRMGLTR